MKNLFNKGQSVGLHGIAAALRVSFGETGKSVYSSDLARQAASLESINETEYANFSGTMENVSTSINNAFQAEGVTLNANQLKAAALTAAAWGNPDAYHQAAMGDIAPSTEGVTSFEPMLNNYVLKPAAEAYNARELEKQMEYNIVFNAVGARQDPFAEAFYPTIVASPDQSAIWASVNQQVVYDPIRRNANGRPAANFGSTIGHRLTDAAVDANILKSNSTDVIPVRLGDNSNAFQFVDPALIPTQTATLGGVDFPTAPLKFNAPEFDLLGLSTNAALLDGGVLTNTDELDSQIELATVYVQVTNGTVSEILSFDTSRMPTSNFQYAVEGQSQRMNLAFSTKTLAVTPNTKLLDQSTSTLLAGLRTGGYSIGLALDVNGSCNIETAVTRVTSPEITVANARTQEGTAVSVTTGAVATALNGLTFKPIGYHLKARRTDSNFRTQGQLVNVNPIRERYTIRLKSPLCTQVPPANAGKEIVNIEALTNFNRMRNSNDAVTALFSYLDVLRGVVNTSASRLDQVVPDIEGIGRHIVKPFFDEVTCDVFEEINGIQSSNRADDVTAVLINKIREVSYRMHRDSNYQTAVLAMNGGVAEKPTLLIGTDQILIRHLMVSGDTRTAGIGFDPQIVDTPDSRMYGKIILTFTRGGKGGETLDPLSSGNHVWIPELSANVQVSRNGQTSHETMVQTRNRHINNLPVFAVINVVNLDKALAGNTIFSMSM